MPVVFVRWMKKWELLDMSEEMAERYLNEGFSWWRKKAQ